MKILIIEDDTRYIKLLEEVLRGAGHDAVSFAVDYETKIESCLQAIQRIQPDIILLDHSFDDFFPRFTGEDIFMGISQKARPRIIGISTVERHYCQENWTGKSHLENGVPWLDKSPADIAKSLLDLIQVASP